MLRKLILTVALAALYQGEPAQLAGSLLTVFIFLVMHMLLKPYLNQGLNVFQRLALLSQFFTVFGGLMFVVTDLQQLQDAVPDSNSKTIMAFLIMIVNAISSSLYPVYRFFNAWSESGEIDLETLFSGVKKGAENCLGEETIESITSTCSCLGQDKEKATAGQEGLREIQDAALDAAQELRQTEIVSTMESLYDEARALKEDVIDEAQDVLQEGKALTREAKNISDKGGKKDKARVNGKMEEDEMEEGEMEEDEIEEDEIEESPQEMPESNLFGNQMPLWISFHQGVVVCARLISHA